VRPSERRRDSRKTCVVPVRVQGHNPDGTEWEEMTTSQDASQGGASFVLHHPHAVGQVFLLSLPLPRNFRRYGLGDTSYRTYALVRNTRSGPGGARTVGVMFLGQKPPKGYEESPGGRFRLPTDPREPAPAVAHGERRRHPRMQLFVNLRLRRTDPALGSQEEQTVTENVGRGGARVPTSLPVAKGERLAVQDLGGSVTTEAEIRNVYIGTDGVPRLNLHFLDPAGVEKLMRAAGAPELPAETAP